MRPADSSNRGAALIFVLLLLSVLLAFSIALQFSALLSWLSVSNGFRHAQAEARLEGRYLHARLLLEQQFTEHGQLPEAPELPDGVTFTETVPGEAGVLHVANPAPGRLGMQLHVRDDGRTLGFSRLQ